MFQVPRCLLSRDQSLRPDSWNLLGTSGNVFDNPSAPIYSVSTPFSGMLHAWNVNATDADPVRPSKGRPVARREERSREAIPTPRFARRPSTMNSLFPAERVHPQNVKVDQQTLQISELHFDKFPTPLTFSCWKIRLKTQISACSRDNVMDQRSGGGLFSGRFLIITLNSRKNSLSEL